MRPVAVIQHEPSVPPGAIADVLARDRVDHFVLEAWRDPVWPEVDDVGALVVLGGTMSVDQVAEYPFLARSRALLGAAVERRVPTLGVCLGSQMMARVLGGDVARAQPRNAFFSPLDLTSEGSSDPLVAPFANGMHVLQFHEDTFTLPPGATPLARSSASGLLQAFRHGDGAYGVQFHFEVDEAILRGWCRNVGDRSMASDWGIPTAALLAQASRHLAAQRRAGEELARRFLACARVAPAA